VKTTLAALFVCLPAACRGGLALFLCAAAVTAAPRQDLRQMRERGEVREAGEAGEKKKEGEEPKEPLAPGTVEAAAPQDRAPGREIRTVASRWRSFTPDGRPEYNFRLWDPYHQNILKADFPVAGNWFVEANAFNNFVFKSRRNLDFSSVFADQITAGTLTFVRHNNFVNENLLFGAELRRFEDAFFPSDFRIRVNGVADYKSDINAFNAGSHHRAHLFDAFVDVKLADFGGGVDARSNFDLLFLRGGLQAFRSDFHGLIFNDAGLGGRLFGEAKRNRLRYDFAWLKLFRKDAISGFTDFTQPSAQQVGIARLTWEDFLRPGWNSEWSFHYNRDRRKITGSSETARTDTYYLGATFNGVFGRSQFNPAAYVVFGHADQIVGGATERHSVAAFTALADWRFPLDFWTFRAGYLFASGDSNPADTRDTGFDAISDGVALFGGPLSYWVGENIRFGRGDFVRANSAFPSLRGANGPVNHINPGLHLVNAGVDVVLSPRFELAGNWNLVAFAASGAYTNRVTVTDRMAGLEENVFLRIKPFLREANQNVILDLGFSALHPRAGIKQTFQTSGHVFTTFVAFRLVY
jgi:hypothetical protein